MNIIQCKKSHHDESVNFVDSNDVFVGYDTSQNCCENAGFRITDDPMFPYSLLDTSGDIEEGLGEYVFDTNYFVDHGRYWDGEEGKCVTFRLTHSWNARYLHLYNSHNGYYSHGFEATIGGVVWQEGSC